MVTPPPLIEKMIRPGLAAIAVFTFSFAPLLPFVDPTQVWIAGVGLAGGSFVLLLETAENASWRRIVSGAILVFIGSALLLRVGDRASVAATANNERCLAIQRDMLSARPRIADGPDKFQALGCRPQGTDPRIFVPPTDRERAAGKALPWGGYPSPR